MSVKSNVINLNSKGRNIYLVQLEQLAKRYGNPEITPAFKTILTRTIQNLLDKCEQENVELPHELRNILQTNPVNSQDDLVDTLLNATIKPAYAEDDLAKTLDFPFNQAQRQAINLAQSGKSFVLTGPAGSGKTTTVKGIIAALVTNHLIGQVTITNHKYLRSGTPNIALVSFTNKAVNNIKKFLPKFLHGNCMTAHKLLEYEPSEETYEDKDGANATRFAFVATRNESNPLPPLDYLLIDEATMMNVPLFNELMLALPNPNLKIILIGDINQLPPVFGKSIFIHAMQKGMEVVELTEVHRQALESPILALAHRILSGKPITAPELARGDWNIDKLAEGNGKLEIRPWKQKNSDTVMMAVAPKFFANLIQQGQLDPEQDTVICPFGKSFGVTVMNEAIAAVHARNIKAPVFEIFAGITAKYFRVGERVLHEKSEHEIIRIEPNPEYFGKTPREPSDTMDYKGIEHDDSKLMSHRDLTAEEFAAAEARIEALMDSLSSHVDDENPRRRACSHIITMRNLDTNEECKVRSAGDVSEMMLAYAVTVHRTQGSEYRRVILMLHHSHATMLSRELIYVAVTRAKESLLIFCENNSFVTGITSQRIKGKSIEEKVKSFEAEYMRSIKNGQVPISEIPINLDKFALTA